MVLTVAAIMPALLAALLAACYIAITYVGVRILSDPHTITAVHGGIVLLAALIVGIVAWGTS